MDLFPNNNFHKFANDLFNVTIHYTLAKKNCAQNFLPITTCSLKKANMVRFKKKTMVTAICSFIVLSLSSCATILSGNDPKIRIEGQVDGPVTITTEKKTYSNITLPAVVKVNRHSIEGQRIKIESEKYNFNDIVLEKKVNNVAYANILLGGLPGLLIDLCTNCVSVPRQTHYNVTGTPKQ